MRTLAASLLALALPALATANGPGPWKPGHGGPGHGGPGHGRPGHGGPGPGRPGHGGPGHGGPGKPGKKPFVSSDKLQALIKTEDLVADSQKLQDFADAHGGNRAFGGGGHNATVDYLFDTLKALDYYDVVKQPFVEIYSDGSGSLTVAGEPVAAQIMTYTPGGRVSGSIVPVANVGCTVDDYPADVAGNIALVARGECSFGEKSVTAKAAGAAGVVVYNNVPGSLAGTLGTPFLEYAPIVGISQEDGQAILDRLAEGEVSAELHVEATVEERLTYNVIAETKEGDHDNVLVVGGHSDSVPAGPGIKYVISYWPPLFPRLGLG